MKTIPVALILVLAMCTPGVAQAQGRVALELTPGVAFPTEKFAGATLDTGFGAGLNVSVRVLPHLSPYVGWGWRRFRADTLFAGSDVDVEETGYAFGLRFDHPLAGGGPALMMRAGGTYNHIELENVEGDLVDDSGHGLGWEAGAGLAWAIGDRWSLTPGVRFRSLEREFSSGQVTLPVTLRYVVAEVGFSRRF